MSDFGKNNSLALHTPTTIKELGGIHPSVNEPFVSRPSDFHTLFSLARHTPTNIKELGGINPALMNPLFQVTSE